jgi:serine O-acetyltransferase
MNEALDKNLDALVDDILSSYRAERRTQRIDEEFLPSRARIVEMLEEIRQVLFPGYFGRKGLTSENVRYHLGNLLMRLGEDLTLQIESCLCYATGKSQQHSDGRAADIAHQFLRRIPAIRKMLVLDAQAAYDGDPAAKSIDEVIYCYPGFFAITVYRVAHELLTLGVPLMPRIMTEHAHSVSGVDIHPGAVIGKSFFIDHGTGVVIGETTRIGDQVKIYQGVTLGAMSFPKDERGRVIKGLQRHPTIEDHVTIYANATILGGDTVIGKGVTVGGNTFITSSITAGTTVTHQPHPVRVRQRRRRAT